MKKGTKKKPTIDPGAVIANVQEKIKTANAYTATIKVLGKIYTSTGSSVREALESLAPGKAKGVSILSMTKGDVKRDKVLNFGQTFRLFSASPLMREIALKQVTMLFDL